MLTISSRSGLRVKTPMCDQSHVLREPVNQNVEPLLLGVVLRCSQYGCESAASFCDFQMLAFGRECVTVVG
jgi:hypothetical protein